MKSSAIVVLLQLLKWRSQPSHRTSGWRGNLREQRRRIHPTTAKFRGSLADARRQAADETGWAPEGLLLDCPYIPEQVLAADFLATTEGEEA